MCVALKPLADWSHVVNLTVMVLIREFNLTLCLILNRAHDCTNTSVLIEGDLIVIYTLLIESCSIIVV